MTRRALTAIASEMKHLHRRLDPGLASGSVDVSFTLSDIRRPWTDLVEHHAGIVSKMPLGTSYAPLTAPNGERILRFTRR